MQNQTTQPLAAARATAALTAIALSTSLWGQDISSYMPPEEAPHEGTWLQWPHHFTYGPLYPFDLDPTWIQMTKHLVQSEKVHIVAYNAFERQRIQNLLTSASISLAKVDFHIKQTNDCWVRDNGPIFARDSSGELLILDWGFNGWGLDAPYAKDNTVPSFLATALGLPVVDAGDIVLEGGAIEIDGNGVLMATRSSLLEPDRNPGLSQAELELALTDLFGVTKFIWLDGYDGGSEDITDAHIDGFARFRAPDTMVTMSPSALSYWGLSGADINTLFAATDRNGQPYNFLQLPLTANNVVTTYGQNLGFKGSYVNFYVGNTVVLIPSYNDPNDALARGLLQQIYPDRAVHSIDVRNLYAGGGMIHCVTQQQPVATIPGLGSPKGVGCSTPPILLESFTAAQIGESVLLAAENLPAQTAAAFLVVGQEVDLPLDASGLPGCDLYSDGAYLIQFLGWAGQTAATTTLPIPDNPGLTGISISTQVGIVTLNGSAYTSNGVVFTII